MRIQGKCETRAIEIDEMTLKSLEDAPREGYLK